MRINTSKSLELAREIKRVYGTWKKVKNSSNYINGRFIIDQHSEIDIKQTKNENGNNMKEDQYQSNNLNIFCFLVMLLSVITITVIYIFRLDYSNFNSFIFVIGTIAAMVFIFTMPESNWFRSKK